MYSVTKTFEFEASHKLMLSYKSPCSRIHGHSYKVEVTIKDKKLNEEGMIIDFTELKVIKEWVMENWDHALIMSKFDPDLGTFKDLERTREIIKLAEIAEENVTAEVMAQVLTNKTAECLEGKRHRGAMIEVAVWETSSNKATFERMVL